jgi:hypothetical protein
MNVNQHISAADRAETRELLKLFGVPNGSVDLVESLARRPLAERIRIARGLRPKPCRPTAPARIIVNVSRRRITIKPKRKHITVEANWAQVPWR